jgi:hypothetical protein
LGLHFKNKDFFIYAIWKFNFLKNKLSSWQIHDLKKEKEKVNKLKKRDF